MFPCVDHASSVVSYPERRDAAHLEAKGPAGTAALCVVRILHDRRPVPDCHLGDEGGGGRGPGPSGGAAVCCVPGGRTGLCLWHNGVSAVAAGLPG